MTAQPATKLDELKEEINATVKKYGYVDDVSMRRIGKKIDSLEKTNGSIWVLRSFSKELKVTRKAELYRVF
jgi:hypothetical protein